MMTGKLYGLGVGPGDSGLITLKTKEILDRAEVIAYPVKECGEESVALNIIKEVVDIRTKEVIEVVFRMERDKSRREQCRQDAAKLLISHLDQGKDIAMVTLGDVAVYSTYTYVHQMIKRKGYETEIVPGITSFSGGAALAEISLVEGNDGLGIVSALRGMDDLEKALGLFENIVLMKAGSSMPEIKALLVKLGLEDRAMVISNVGLEDEYIGKIDLNREYGYFTTLIIKKGGL